ncbi:MAG: hypothetical protein KGJ00_05810 [Bradyrhizobium sp.]|nr:hypothetical protein [Bradyrhizobium sp.]
MKLNAMQLDATLKQLNIQAIPDDHPTTAKLCDLFGEHTFFVDGSGLKVLEPAGAPGTEVRSAEVISLADWSDAAPAGLTPHEPEQTGVIVVFKGTRH